MNRQDIIRAKGFDMMQRPQTEYGRIKSGTKQLADAVINLGAIEKTTKGYVSKGVVLKALFDNDVVPAVRLQRFRVFLCSFVTPLYHSKIDSLEHKCTTETLL